MLISRKLKETTWNIWVIVSLVIVLTLPVAIAFGLVLKSWPIIIKYPLTNLLFQSNWQPTTGQFGFLPFILGSVAVTVSGFIIMVPLTLFPAIYLTQYASTRVWRIMQPVIDILAGIPSVIHGVFGVLVIVPFISEFIGPMFGQSSSGYTLLAGAIILAIATLPFVLHMLLEVFRTIPVELKEASLSLGATYWETIKKVLLKKAMPGIVASYALGISKAFGETIAVLMVVGNVIKMPNSLLEPGYPLPSLIANNYGEMLSIPMYDSALMFAALLLFVVVIVFNMLSRYIVTRTTVY